jgi:hypothetical protein
LRCHDAQILVAAHVASVDELAAANPTVLWRSVESVANSLEGKRLLRGSRKPDLAEVSHWIECARQARSLLAA